MARKSKKRKQKKPRTPKRNYQTPLSHIRTAKIRGPRYYLQHARDYPIFGCWIFKDWKKSGIAPVVVAREQSPDKVIFAVCLLDIWCLGVKDAYAKANISRAQFKRELRKMCSGAPKKCSPEFAHEIIYGALEYANQYGFKPHADFKRQMVDHVLEPPDVYPRTHNLKFGKDGKPFFYAGPYDNQRKIDRIINTLDRTAGEGNYYFMFPIDESDLFDAISKDN